MKQIIYDHRQDITFILIMGAILWASFMFGENMPGEKHTRYEFNVPEVDLSQAQALINSGAIIIDVRSEEAFDARHIAGAIVIPLAVLRAGIPDIIALRKHIQIIVYCNMGLSKGPEATHILQKAGFQNVANIKSGIEGWEAEGLPITRA